jgi:hypothetical protein
MPRFKIAAALIAFGLLASATSAKAAFVSTTTEPSGELKFFIDIANSDVGSFSGKVGSNNSGPVVNVTTTGNVTTGAGYANIKPVHGTSLTDLVFSPVNNKLFSDFFFRGQLLDDGDITLKVNDAQGDPTQIFTFANIKKNADFGSLGIILDLAFPSDVRTIQSIELISAGFKEVKQIDFSLSPVAAVPLPAALPMFGAAIAGLGGLRRLARRKRNAMLA